MVADHFDHEIVEAVHADAVEGAIRPVTGSAVLARFERDARFFVEQPDFFGLTENPPSETMAIWWTSPIARVLMSSSKTKVSLTTLAGGKLERILRAERPVAVVEESFLVDPDGYLDVRLAVSIRGCNRNV